MTVFKVSFCLAWGQWRDFTFVTCRNKREAVIKALEEIDVPESMNDKLIITTSVGGIVGKNKKPSRR